VSVSGEARAVLRELGLTEYEARAYLSLLEGGPMTAGRVSGASGVPYSKVYEALNSLEGKGWVRAEAGRPSRYFPRSPSEALGAARLRFESRMAQWEKTVLGELQPLYERREIRERPDIWIVRGEFNILAKLQEVLATVEREIMIAAPALSEAMVEAVYPALARLRDTGVRVLLMASRGAEAKGLEKVCEVAEVRVRDQMFGGGVIADGREAVLLLGGEGGSTLAIWSDHAGLVKLAKDYFQYLWDSPDAERYSRHQ